MDYVPGNIFTLVTSVNCTDDTVMDEPSALKLKFSAALVERLEKTDTAMKALGIERCDITLAPNEVTSLFTEPTNEETPPVDEFVLVFFGIGKMGWIATGGYDDNQNYVDACIESCHVNWGKYIQAFKTGEFPRTCQALAPNIVLEAEHSSGTIKRALASSI